MALASWNCPELLSILPSSSVPIMGSFGYDPRNRDPSGPRYEWPSILIHTHILTHISSLAACVLYLLSRDQAGFEPLNGGDSWRPRRVKTLTRGHYGVAMYHTRIKRMQWHLVDAEVCLQLFKILTILPCRHPFMRAQACVCEHEAASQRST